ncbi:N-acetylmuramoyl-L-alanine amidase [Flavobacterium sp.]|uniref:N-acetylmuramoyl-L-alanine amidase n=1 Tax=Flavobacterium sp. TaxID=239 RepID=UPI00286CB107|nr:N-acetylmuramoyl-L-alanine amidase [Flavobacterium sp.]
MYSINKIKPIFATLLLIFSLSTFAQTNYFVVTLDAGHGGHDFGAVYSGRIEKNVALAVALKVGKLLEENPKIEVIFTRKTDVFIDLIERANIANRADANIFVSIHCNANKNTAADGTETYVMGISKNASNLETAKKENSVITLEKDYKQKYEGFDPNNPESMIGMTLMQEEYLDNSISLAGKIEEEFAAIGKKLRQGGVKQERFMVLHKAYMPRVLVEMGFISNSTEGALLASEEGQDEIARAISNAIISYKREFFDGGTFDTNKPSQRIIEKPIKDTSTPAKPKIIIATPEIKNTEDSLNSKGILYKVQLSASTKKLELSPKNFKGLDAITIANSGNLYKYMYGQTSNYEEAKKLLQEAKSKGYSSAYLIAFKQGKSISIQEALKN